ncbi:MAG: flagellar filament capping protein FliD [Lachnospiraceae bacterium]|nr:flagellar filament capping protein FliD [Lachnospiraceae bacterium]MBR1913908.1 flagellar filament capping protein FliD [Lachnospiraceae bacterium]
MSSVDMSSLFGSSQTQSTSLTGMLGDYASIKNGSYGKLLKAYYKKQETDATSDEVKEENTKRTKLKNYASELKDAASALSDPSLYKEGDYEVTLSDGTKQSSKYDMDKILEKAKSFVSAYNSAVKNGASFDEDSGIAKRTLSLISYTKKNSALLSELGITTSSKDGEEGQLTIDEDKFKKASAGTVKSLFSGSGSYGSVVENKASLIASLAESQATKISSYNASGSYDSGSSALSSFFSSGV